MSACQQESKTSGEKRTPRCGRFQLMEKGELMKRRLVQPVKIVCCLCLSSSALMAQTIPQTPQQAAASPAAVSSTPNSQPAAAAPLSTKIVPGSKVYIEKMDGFENYLTAGFAKKRSEEHTSELQSPMY